MTDKPISDRAQYILKALIEQFIREGQPIGSKALVQAGNLNVSSATVRGVMADLEAIGLIHSPHTSAGRVPTSKGYRFFVDSLLTVQPIEAITKDMLQQHFDVDMNHKQMVASVSHALSGMTELAGLVTIPTLERNILQDIEFIPLSAKSILVVLVFSDQQVQNRIIQVKREYSRSELQQAGNYLTELLKGKDLAQARHLLVTAMNHDKQQMNTVMQAILDEADQAFDVKPDENVVISGEVNLLNYADATGMGQLRQLFQAFSDKQDIMHLLDKSINAEGVNIFLGEESGYEILGDCSLVTSSYSVDGEVVGVLGVIGPTRMQYDKVVPMVDITAKLLSAALKS